MRIPIFKWVCLFYVCILFCSCSYSKKLIEGDLLFQNLDCGDLCDAIEAVTEGIDGKDFSHCAMVVNVNDTLKIIKAIGGKVQLNSIQNFFARSGDTSKIINITVGRLKIEYDYLIAGATSFAKKQKGQPYDDEFLLNNGKWYCSELIFQAFKEANKQVDFFQLRPMTFKDPKTKNFFPAWIDYYKLLNRPIPEGQPGINPGLISLSSKIKFIKIESAE